MTSPETNNNNKSSDEAASDSGLKLTCCPPKNIWENIKRECKFKNVWMTGELSFGKVNWIKAFGSSALRPFNSDPMGRKVFVVWRILLAMLGFSVWVWSISTSTSQGTWIYYLTHWMLTVKMCYLVTLAISTVMANFVYGLDSTEWQTKRNIPWYAKNAWLGNSWAVPAGMFITLLYWLILKSYQLPLSVMAHGGLWCILCFDHLVGMQPFILPQMIWLVAFSFCYSIWTIIHYQAGLVDDPVSNDRYIYPVIDWGNKPLTAAGWSFGSTFALIPLCFTLFWSLNFGRKQAIYVDQQFAVMAEVSVNVNEEKV
jgi:hypothetical protein